MPLIVVKEVIEAPILKVWDLVKKIENYPKFMKPVHELKILSRDGDITDAEWEVELKGSILRWSERDICYPSEHRIEFAQIEGDLEKFEGNWNLKKISEHVTEVELQVNFEIGIPMLRDMLNPVAEKALRDNAITMLRSFQSHEVVA
ncbi:polyketide cyclase/dehydrase (plasmid) [Ralstonia pseudosolanacearum]|uniref:Polyketide cyclase/dehydrase n=1 Tax=Ralstonia solanacearum TaxID=305 RepID=A0AA92JXE0_RALSL|nr:SRPBCC family protein [Ralstonia pseudosolanacearum]QOK94283.1 polyketide cyclase/dehydrase [Ralstonia pseudosolanacearum]QOK99158.1 polyketide cyclase/dehydrase [Ralstonia pseudosolanacearum]